MAKEQLKAKKGAIVTEINGVKYFKLQSSYPGDYTKNCGLLGNEIDENFYFLRSYDIEDIAYEKGNLILTRVDGDTLSVEITQPEFILNKVDGHLTIVFPDGTTQVIDGLVVEGKDVHVSTDGSIDGDGTKLNPLHISPAVVTGTYGPVEELKDLTDYSSLEDGREKGHRVITKENVDNFGKLYTYSEVQKLKELLADSGWRIPTKEDWDKMLNTLECPEYKNHDSKKSQYLGQLAGYQLKSEDLWVDTKVDKGIDKFGFSVLPVGYCKDYGMREENFGFNGLYRNAAFWTDTELRSEEVVAKYFDASRHTVFQDTVDAAMSPDEGRADRLSVRLVRDGVWDYNEVEYIAGTPFRCVSMYNECDNTVTIWTKTNVNLGSFGIRPVEWEDCDRIVEVKYFINEWDGRKWVKHEMREGDSVVILNHTVPAINEYYMKMYNSKTEKYEYILLTTEQAAGAIEEGFKFEERHLLPVADSDAPDFVLVHTPEEKADYHEWRIINTELVDTAEYLKEEFLEDMIIINEKIDDEIDRAKEAERKLQENIDAEIARAQEVEKQLWEGIEKEAKAREEVDAQLWEGINNETARAQEVEKQLWDGINNESARAQEVEKQLWDGINAEAKAREEVDTQLWTAINDETARAQEVEKQLWDGINAEAKAREEVDAQLWEGINNETARAQEVEKQLWEGIEKEAKAREEVDTQLWTAVNNEIIRSATIDENIAKNIIGVSEGDVWSSGYTIDFENLEYVEIDPSTIEEGKSAVEVMNVDTPEELRVKRLNGEEIPEYVATVENGELKTYKLESTNHYIGSATTVYEALNVLDDALKAEEADRVAKDEALQGELDATQVGAGLAEDGTYVPDTNSTYIKDAVSLADADSKLDAATKTVQGELDATQAGAGLAEDGSYINKPDANYIKDATSLADADDKLDAALKAEETDRVAKDEALQGELDATQAGAGLDESGSYIPQVDANYIKDAVSLADADSKLDAALKVEEENRIAQDIATEEYEMSVTDGMILRRNGGEEITIKFNANFGGMPAPIL